eukprot:138853_1
MISLFVALYVLIRANGETIEVGDEATIQECRDHNVGEPKPKNYEVTIELGWGVVSVGTGVFISKCAIKCKPTTETFNDGTTKTYTSFASTWCFGKDNAVCECQNVGKRINIATARCKGRRRLEVEEERRRLLTPPLFESVTDATYSCLDDFECAQILFGYEIGSIDDTVTSRRSHCESFSGCTDAVFDLFNGAADDSDCTEPCQGLNSFEYTDDGVGRTAQEAQQLCRDLYDSDLATIRDMEDLVIAAGLIGNGASPWIGLWSGLTGLRHDFTYLDGSECPDPSECNGQFNSGECVCGQLWRLGKTRPCGAGSRCTRIVDGSAQIDNDKSCYRRILSAVLCNCVGSAL